LWYQLEQLVMLFLSHISVPTLRVLLLIKVPTSKWWPLSVKVEKLSDKYLNTENNYADIISNKICLKLRGMSPRDLRLSAKLAPTFADRRCHVVSVTDPSRIILGFLDRSRYFFFQVAPQLYSRGLVDPVPDPLLLRKSGSVGN
jgi:hypothetical protein